MTTTPLVSIIALCYNQEKFIEETLNSIKDQTYQNIQLIIADDCSSDTSVEVIKKWISTNNYDCEFIIHQENRGICKTLNEALLKVKGEFYHAIACDDIMLKDKIKVQTEILSKSDNNVAMVYSDAYLIDDNGNQYDSRFIQRHRPRLLNFPSGNIFVDLAESNFIPAMGNLIKTKCVRKIGGYDERLTYEDYDMWLRISKKYEIVYSDYVSVKYRLHSNNMHRSKLFNINRTLNNIRIYKKHLNNEVIYSKFMDCLESVYLRNDFDNAITFIPLLKKNDKVLKVFIKYKLPSFIYRLINFIKNRLNVIK
ncbi:glycosyltransferase [Flammeovirga pectinis]|uniref:Glycosyltransferase n=1 Tax=Flammeovirga pectinis TaxID=2494373 RepID=A0A3Q9FMV5_9BACT|nr:glycosyltransferase [Flammeovirga pectinis]AZQ61913.1 glycosyltransferase [Flammeovirga pectinis]